MKPFYNFNYKTDGSDDPAIQVMVEKIVEIIKNHPDKSILFIVDGAQFPGKMGLLQLLKNRKFLIYRAEENRFLRNGPDSLCNYTIGYSYRELLIEAAKYTYFNYPAFKKKKSHYRKFLAELINYIDTFSSPESVFGVKISGYEYLKLNELFEPVKKYTLQPHHKMFQKENHYVDPELLFKTDLYYAIEILISHAYYAKERGYGYKIGILNNKFVRLI